MVVVQVALATDYLQKRKRRKSLPTTRRGSVYIHANTYVTGHHNPVNISQSKPTEPDTGPRDHMSRVVLREAELHVLNLSDSQVRISVAEFQQYSSRSPVVPKSSEFEDALALFRNSPDLRPENPDLVNMWCWIRRVHENLQLLSDKLKPHWSSFLTEGFFDANVWGPIIDSLWLGEQDMILVRKEVELLRKDEKRKLDGLIRYGDGVREFDVGVLEVSKPERPKSNQKTVIDMHKVTHAMAVILFDLRRTLEHRSPVERSSLQVIGFVCSGWGCVVLRMWCDGSTFIVKAKSFALVFGRDLEPNVEFLRTLVRYRDLARLTVSTVSYQAESDL